MDLVAKYGPKLRLATNLRGACTVGFIAKTLGWTDVEASK